MDASLLSWYQALQLVALGPCLFMLFFLCVAGRKFTQVLVPFLYFLSLTCGFIMPLREALGLPEWLQAGLLLLARAAAPISFLLIVQFMSGTMPRPLYWMILAIPLIGGGPLAIASVMTDAEVCIYNEICTSPQQFNKLYNIFSISLTCLLTLVIYRRLDRVGDDASENRQRYALVLAIVALNLALLGIDLMQISGHAEIEHARMAKTVVRIGFIYLVLTSMFRVFDRSVEFDYARVPSMRPKELSSRDLALADRIGAVFAREHLHRDMDLSREKLARALAVNESLLSRVVNQRFGQNISMLINQHRVEEAKVRLAEEDTAITIIAFEVGFSSIPSFNRVFKQLSGMSPTEYRQSKGVKS